MWYSNMTIRLVVSIHGVGLNLKWVIDIVKIYSDIDDLMNDTIFDGRSLSDIADEIEIE